MNPNGSSGLALNEGIKQSLLLLTDVQLGGSHVCALQVYCSNIYNKTFWLLRILQLLGHCVRLSVAGGIVSREM